MGTGATESCSQKGQGPSYTFLSLLRPLGPSCLLSQPEGHQEAQSTVGFSTKEWMVMRGWGVEAGSAAARPWLALQGGDRRGGGGGGAALQRRRDLRTKAIQASKVWLGVGLSFPEAAPKQLPRAETQTFYCHLESRGRRLRPARPGPARQSVGPRGAARAPPCSRSPQLQRRSPGPDARASSPELKAKFGRGAGRAASERPRRPQCAQPRRGRR